MPFAEKSKQFAKSGLQKTDGLGIALGTWIANNPRKFIAILIFEGYVHSLVAHHIREARDLANLLMPF